MDAVKWECEALDERNGIFLMHAGCGIAVNPIYHDFVLIAYVAHGEGVYEYDGFLLELREGDIFIVNPDFVYRFYPSQRYSHMELYYCFLSKKKAHTVWNELKNDFPELTPFFDNTSIKHLHIKDSSNKEIRELFIRMIDEFMHCPSANRIALNNYLMIMIVKLFRRYQRAINNPVFAQNRIVDEVIRLLIIT